MQEDAKGFNYPKVDVNLCIDCNICDKTCPFHKQYSRYDNFESPRYFAMRCLDEIELKKSQSGGAFYLLSNAILEDGGIVYGAGFGEGFRVEHFKAETKSERDRMRGSKYVQSDLNDVFLQIKENIKQGQKVLFCGTPCQVAGLRAFFGRRQPDQLITVDLLCHGVASPSFWQCYLNMIEQNGKKRLTAVNMRDKRYGWLSSDETYTIGKKELHKNTFYSLYYNGYISREGCFQCPFTTDKRVADISLGDYHGWNKDHDQFTDNSGVSLVLVNSDKGKALLDTVIKGNDIYCKEQTVNPQDHVALTYVAKQSNNYTAFWSDFEQKGVKYVCKKYGDMSFKTQMHIKLAKFLRHG
jgi:coenzyme F420-reducing hydrogenase beta subunit